MDDMNATPVTKLQATMSGGGGDGPIASSGPPSYSELLKEMNGPPQQPRFGSLMAAPAAADSDDDGMDDDVEEIRELPPRSRAVRFAPMAAMQPVQQYGGMNGMMQMPDMNGMNGMNNGMNGMNNGMNGMQMPMMPQPAPPPQLAKPARARKAEGLKGFAMKHKTILIIAIAAFLAMTYGAPRLRTIPQFVSASGGLNMLGIAALSLAVGASSELAKLVN